MRLTIGSRTSDLARIQAYDVAQALKKNFPEISHIQFHFKKSLGDINLTDPLWKMPEKGVFTEDLKQDLLQGVCDLVVHSWKDLPVEMSPNTEIIATLPRADVRDVLLFKKSALSKLKVSKETVKIFSSSPRRAFNLKPFLKKALPFSVQKIEFLPVRGNILTRCQKLIKSDEVHGLVVAKAALDRLLSTKLEEFAENQKALREVLSQCLWMVLPLSNNPPAAAQGALAIEIQKNREDLRKMLRHPSFNCIDTYQNVQKERNWLAEQGGGCHQKLGVVFLSRDYGVIQSLRGETPKGTSIETLQIYKGAVPKASSKDKIWPRLSSQNFFSRKKLPSVEIPQKDLWIAKSLALPDEALQSVDSNNQIIWTAGLETWTALAVKGLWVNGSAEGFGEKEDPQVDWLAGRSPNWVKLSHSKGFQGPFPLIATYELIENSLDYKGLEKYDFFYWKSGSEFLQALKKVPTLKDKTHGCGPGHTAEIIKSSGVEPFICLNQKQWLDEVSP